MVLLIISVAIVVRLSVWSSCPDIAEFPDGVHCCLPIPMSLASEGEFDLPACPFIWPGGPSFQWGLFTNPGVIMWCVCGCS